MAKTPRRLERIGVALDHSPMSHHGLLLALRLARAFSAPLEVFHVLDLIAIEGWLPLEPGEGWVGTAPSLSAAIQSHLEESARSLEEEIRARAEQEGLPITFHILKGVISEELLQASRGFSLFVVGQKGEHARFHNRLLGSVTERLAKQASVPLLVATSHPPELRAILVGLDGSSQSLRALELAALLAQTLGSKLHLTSIAKKESQAKKVLEQGEAFLKEQGSTPHLHPLVAVKPGEALLVLAQELSVDLLAIGAYGKRRFFEAFLGSTTTTLLHRSPVHLLLTRKLEEG